MRIEYATHKQKQTMTTILSISLYIFRNMFIPEYKGNPRPVQKSLFDDLWA